MDETILDDTEGSKTTVFGTPSASKMPPRLPYRLNRRLQTVAARGPLHKTFESLPCP